MPTQPVLVFEVSREAVDGVTECGPNATSTERYMHLAESTMDACSDIGIHSIVLPPGLTIAFKGMVTTEPDQLPDVDEEDYSEDDETDSGPVLNEAKTPGQVAYEAFRDNAPDVPWSDPMVRKEFWDRTAAAAIAHASETFKP